MKNILKLIRRSVGTLLFSIFLLLLLNIVLMGIIFSMYSSNESPYKTATEAGNAVVRTESGYSLSEEMTATILSYGALAILIDNTTGEVVWHTDNLPDTIPASYTLFDISQLTLGYIDGYPTFTGNAENGILVLGYPRESYWKHLWPSWEYQLISHMPQILFVVAVFNIMMIFIIYMIANSTILASVKPLIGAIQALPTGKPVHIREKGLLSEVSANINRTSDVLQLQQRQLAKKETARANWIAGVSHDIRTPLSMVMGYAGQLKDNPRLTEEDRQKASVIVKQSERIRNLINDLNLASKLEYDMQPIHLQKQNLIAIVRQVVVDFINMDIDDKYPIEWDTDETLTTCPINADKDLMKRAISNLIQNSINHNEQGCNIYISVLTESNTCAITVSDDGIGASVEQIEKLNNTPHYMVCDENTMEQRHGLGLLIVKQILAAHRGTTTIKQSPYGGFCVTLTLPLQE